MSSMMSMQWAMVCSVKDNFLLPQIEDFGIWLCKKLGEKASELGLTHEFDELPEVVLNAELSNWDNFVAAYKKVTSEHPGVMVIFQILPSQKSCIYGWMKQVSYDIGRIRQGIALENALSKFDGLDLQEVLVKIIHWISLSISRIVSNNDLRVGSSKEPTMAQGQIIRMNGVESAVQSVLHSCENVDKGWPASSVKVSGLPSSYNQYQLAAVFYTFHVVYVHFEENYAIVCFVNKFQAAQAAMLFDRLQLDDDHILTVTPLCDNVKRQVYLARIAPVESN